MELCLSEQEDNSLISLHNSLRLTDSSIAYENMDSIQCDSFVNYAQCVCREVDKCRCQPVQPELKMPFCALNTADLTSLANETVDDNPCNILPTADDASSIPIIETNQTIGNEDSVVADSILVDKAELRLLSESQLGNIVDDSAVQSLCENLKANDHFVDVCEQHPTASSSSGDGAASECSNDVNIDLTRDTNQVSATSNALIANDEAILPEGISLKQVDTEITLEETSDLAGLHQREVSSEDNKKKGCRVRFNEHNVVTSYLEPHLPWKDG